MNESQRSLINQVKQIYISAPYLKDIIKIIDQDCREFSKLGGEAECMLVTGESGVGKSKLIEHYLNYNRPKEKLDRIQTQVLVNALPGKATPRSEAINLLIALGDRSYEKIPQTEVRLTDHLVKLLINTGVELIILDEFQHLIENISAKILSDAANWIKTLINSSNIPVVLFGMPWSSQILAENSQLAGRFEIRCEIQPFMISSKGRLERYRSFLEVVDKKLPFGPSANLASMEIALPLFAFCRGNLRRLMKLIYRASELSILDESKGVDRCHLVKAADKYLSKDYPVNPFNVELSDLSFEEQIKPSRFNSNWKKGERCWTDNVYQRLTMSQVLSAK